jgi:acetoin utilization protein AcuB
MLLVEDSMTREVSTIELDATAAEALALCRERRIRHLPVLEEGRLIGIASDRDLRSATPALEDPDRAVALQRLRVKDIMNREVVTAHPKDPIEDAASEMYEHKIGCLPVVSEGNLVGIITSSDVMRALVMLLGAHEPGSPVEIEMPRSPGALVKVADVIKDSGATVVSVLTPPGHGDRKMSMIFRLATIDPRPVITRLKAAGYKVLWPLEGGMS